MNAVRSQKGFTIVEALIGVSIFTVVLAALIPAFGLYLNVAVTNTRSVKATFLAQEAIEGVKYLRDQNWNENINARTTGAVYYLNFTPTTGWAFTSNNALIDDMFDRHIVFSPVYRNSSDSIAESGTLDTDTKEVSVSVSWAAHGEQKSVSISSYISNIYTE